MSTNRTTASGIEQALQRALEEAVRESGSPGAVGYVGDLERTHFHGATGYRQITPARKPAHPDTMYDLASLTKVMATTTAAMLQYERGALDLDDFAAAYLPIPGFEAFTIRQLLTHTSGLVPTRAYYKDQRDAYAMLQRFAQLPPDFAPGARRQYSDVGFMILGAIVELVTQDSLDAYCTKHIFTPLGMERTTFNPPEPWRGDCAATENCRWRGRVMVGQVHDENAYAVGGVSGHAGLFSTAEDIATFCRALMSGKLLAPWTLAEMTKLGQLPFYPWQGLAWKLDPWETGVEGHLPSRKAFGHTGWTGTSIWMDPETGRFAILLGNTCHPSRSGRYNRRFRQAFYSEVAKQLYTRSTSVHTGIDRMLWDGFGPLRNKRVALLTNSAAVDELGRPVLEVFRHAPPEVSLALLYSPEHGFQGQAEAGETVASDQVRAGRQTVPVVSLYGDRKEPSQGELADIDLFLVDLPDIGARYYTYMSTMKDCIAACARAGKPVMVLDRPNPLGGAIIEGPIAERTSSPVSSAAVPIRHGLTLGELALWFTRNELKALAPTVMVYPLDNWRRRFLFHQVAYPWVPPSPNIPTADTALLYVGTCLFEGTNLNEGRGTEQPFHLFGAPWLNPNAIIRRIDPGVAAGCSLQPVTYTPQSIPGKASSPKYEGQRCEGVHITITDRGSLRPFTLALGLIQAIRHEHPRRFEFTSFFDTLAGTDSLRQRLEADEPAEAIARSFESAWDHFKEARVLRYE